MRRYGRRMGGGYSFAVFIQRVSLSKAGWDSLICTHLPYSDF